LTPAARGTIVPSERGDRFVLVNVIRFLIALFFLRLILHTVADLLKSRAPRKRPRSLDAELVRDRICNTYIPRAKALVARVGGRDEAFCSPACRDRALSEMAQAS
jgi:hypothetical protein